MAFFVSGTNGDPMPKVCRMCSRESRLPGESFGLVCAYSLWKGLSHLWDEKRKLVIRMKVQDAGGIPALLGLATVS